MYGIDGLLFFMLICYLLFVKFPALFLCPTVLLLTYIVYHYKCSGITYKATPLFASFVKDLTLGNDIILLYYHCWFCFLLMFSVASFSILTSNSTNDFQLSKFLSGSWILFIKPLNQLQVDNAIFFVFWWSILFTVL